jgi:hypothetical protein
VGCFYDSETESFELRALASCLDSLKKNKPAN